MTTQNYMEREDVRAEVKSLFREMINEIRELPPVQEPPDRVGIEGAMEETGLEKASLYQKTKPTCADPIPHQKFGKRLIFSRKQLRAWMEKNTVTRVSYDKLAADQLQKESRKRGR